MSGFLESPKVEFNFCGFRANAWTLQNQGWQLSASERMSPSRYGREIQLMLNRDGLTMVSSLELLDMEGYMRAMSQGMPVAFDIVGVCSGGRSTIMPFRDSASFQFAVADPLDNQFMPIDCTPRIQQIDLAAVDFYKYGVFKRLHVGSEIYLPEKTVDELLNEILKKQEPRQKEIRKNQKRREFMEGFNAVGEKPADIRAQLIAV